MASSPTNLLHEINEWCAAIGPVRQNWYLCVVHTIALHENMKSNENEPEACSSHKNTFASE